MRQVYALLGLVRRYGAERVRAECARALDADMVDVRRLERMVKLALPAAPALPSNVIPLARYLRPPSQYALPLASGDLRTVMKRLKLGRLLDTLPERLALAKQQKMAHAESLAATRSPPLCARSADIST